MILQRMSAAIRRRDWAAVAIEFAVVVLGIFVALQADNWNQARKDRQLEHEYIARLVDDTSANLATLREHERIFEEKARFIMELPDLALEAAVRDDPMAFMHQLDDSSYLMIPDLRSETWEEMESSGRQALLRDAGLRSAISSNLNEYRSYRPVLEQTFGDYRRILFETLPGSIYYRFRVEAAATDTDGIIAAVEAFRSDPRFGAAANAEVIYATDGLYWLRIFREQTEQILKMLQEQAEPL